jgi:lipoprotein-anchoring transpeptidase ErfK/SrfK
MDGARDSGRPRAGRRVRAAAAVSVLCVAAGLLAAACSGSPGSAASGQHPAHGRKSAAPKPRPAMQLTITPAAGSKHVEPGRGISVTAGGGTLTSVSVHSSGDPVTGTMNADATAWHSSWTLGVAAHYTVTAIGKADNGQSVTKTSSFTTLTPAATFQTMIFEGQGATYGVGMPIILDFSQPIKDKAAVERALQITTSRPVVGAWYWDNDQTLAFRPQHYWPANTTVSFTGRLNGVEGAPGMYGYHTLTQSFKIGSSLIVVASAKNHFMNLYRNGKLFKHWPISTGRSTLPTPNGTYLTIDKHNPVLMKGPGYREEVPWSVRFTWTGDYLHDAFWSVGQQGSVNVSHGCVNMAPADAEMYYKMEVPGDPVTIVGSPKAGKWDNGWTEWFLTWQEYLKGSALHLAVQAGPHGSTFVSPASVTADAAKSPLGTSSPGNWHAA